MAETSAKAAASSSQQIYDGLQIPRMAQSSKLQGKQVTLQNPAKPSEHKKARKVKRQAEQRKLHHAMVRGNKSRGILPPIERKATRAMGWDVAKGLHALWLGYMQELLGIDLEGSFADPPIAGPSSQRTEDDTFSQSAGSTLQTKLAKADFHGAYLIGSFLCGGGMHLTPAQSSGRRIHA
jgi:ribonuclease P protein subunit POP4